MSSHPLEVKWNTTASDILTAIEHGFRAQADVKGKLAELYLFRRLETLQELGTIEELVWQDEDGKTDFLLTFSHRELRIECKNVRSPVKIKSSIPAKLPASVARVEWQKTRNSKGGEPTRGYKTDEFNILAACLFQFHRKWEHIFIATKRLITRPDPMQNFLQIMQPVPFTEEGYWHADPVVAFNDSLSGAE